MSVSRLFRNLRTIAFVAMFVGLLGGASLLYWANRTGLPDSWRAAIEQQVRYQGAHLAIGSLSYVPFRGIVARDVRFYADKEYHHELSRVEQVILTLDKTKLARGEIRLTKIELSKARLSLPVDPKKPDSETLDITDVSGTVLMPGGRLLEIRDARGRVAGIEIDFSARLLGYQPEAGKHKEDPGEGQRREILARVIHEIEKWSFDRERPPAIRVFAEGDLTDRSSIVARMSLSARDFGKNGHTLDELEAEGTLIGKLLTFTKLAAKDSRGSFEGRVDYDITTAEGRFSVVSGLELPPLLQAWAGVPPIREISLGGNHHVEADGDFRLHHDRPPDLKMIGHLRCESVMLKGVPFDSIQSAFSWKDGTLFLRELSLDRTDGKATGKVLVEGPLVRIGLRCSLPPSVMRPFFRGQPLAIVMGDFTSKADSTIHVELEGGFDTRDKASWAYTGRGKLERMSYKGVPVESAQCEFAVSHRELDFYKGTVVFDYSDYPLRKAFSGPDRGTATVGRIRYNGEEKTVDVENVEGAIWAAPMVRFFAAPIADNLEIYRFHRPPVMTASGVIDVTPAGRTNLSVGFQSDHPADYHFLGQNLTLSRPGGEVRIRGARTTVDNLRLEAFGGPVAGQFTYTADRKLAGELRWTRLSLAGVASAYGFQINGNGAATGRIEFVCTNGEVRTMTGEGLLALEKAELFSVPMLGPLSPLVAGTLGDKRAGYERAKDAFLTFVIRGGKLVSDDFHTETSSLVFTGDGSVDLSDLTIDVNMRMNARGLLGIITLPLRPFYGLFQFRGTGPMKKPEWQSVMFTSPPDGQKKVLLDPPRALVVPEN